MKEEKESCYKYGAPKHESRLIRIWFGHRTASTPVSGAHLTLRLPVCSGGGYGLMNPYQFGVSLGEED